MGFLEILFPKKCCGCGAFGDYFCLKCIKEIKQGDLVCPVCERSAIGGATHPICKRRYGLDGLWSLGAYLGSLKKAVQKLKYKFVKDLAGALVDLTLNYWAVFGCQVLEEIKKDGVGSWVVTPVPLHPKRERWRGFNQSVLLGQILAKRLGLNYQEVLIRVKNTKPQMRLNSTDRRANIKAAFSLSKPLPRRQAGYPLNPNIILVDDVWTTGSTLKECCYTLKRGGAKKVWALTLAR